MHLILPVSGFSTRYPGLRPKYLLTHPSGDLMILEAIKGLNLKKFKDVVVVCLKKHDQEYDVQSILKKQFNKVGLLDKLNIIVINKSNSQPHTIFQALIKEHVNGSIFIKDVDNYFDCNTIVGNTVCYAELEDTGKIIPSNKSYVLLSEKQKIINIVEKKVISNTFCSGGYGFSNATDFKTFYKKIQNKDNVYISHIIYQMILAGHSFIGQKVENYVDWGTLEDWNSYRNKFSTLFIDLDGTLVKNSAEYISPYWGETAAIEDNVRIINHLYESGFVQIILVTTRKKSYDQITKEQLERIGLKYHQIIYNLFHAKRIIVNDYSSSNPYKSCDAINLRRDSDELVQMLKESLDIGEFR